MNRNLRNFAIALLFLLFVIAIARWLKQKPKLDYEKLVVDLVNQTPAPTPKRKIVFPKDYDWKEVARIEKTLQTIIDNFDDAWPMLVKHVNDKEYSFTAWQEYDNSEAPFDENYSVGDVCKTLLRENLTKVAMKLRVDTVPRNTLRSPDFILDTKENPNKFQNWFTEQIKKQRKFHELQIEYAESAFGFIPHTDPDDPRLKEYRVRAIEDYKMEIESVKVKKVPLLLERFRISDIRNIISRDPSEKKIAK